MSLNEETNLIKRLEEFQKEYHVSSAYSPAETPQFYSAFNSYNSSAVRASVVNRFIGGGKRFVYTVATLAMLQNNLMQQAHAAFTSNVNAGQIVLNEIVSGGSQIIDGGSALGGRLDIDGSQYLSNGGRAIGTTIAESGYQYINDGAIASNAVVVSSGYQYVGSGGSALNTTITSSGEQWISSGGYVSRTRIIDYGNQYIDSSGYSIDAQVSSGSQVVMSYGTAVNNYFYNYGQQYVSGGSALDNYFYEAYASQTVYGGYASGNYFYGANTSMWQNLSQSVYNYGSAYNNVFSATNNFAFNYGGQQMTQGGYASGNYFHTMSGMQYISSGGSAEDTVFYGVGYQSIVGNGASAINTVYSNGGSQFIAYNGVADGTTLNGGYITSSGYTSYVSAIQSVYASGSALNTVLNSGATQYLVYGSSYVYPPGTYYYGTGYASNTTINSGGRQMVYSGTAYNNTVNSGGYQEVYYGGNASVTAINKGGSSYIASYGRTSDVTLNSGGSMTVDNYGSASGVSQNSGGILSFTLQNGVATLISGTNASGQNMYAYNGTANNFILYSGAYVNANSGALAQSFVVSSGATLNVAGNASAIYTSQGSGGNINTSVGAGSTTNVNGTNQDGGTFALSGSSASGFIINSGGYQYVYSGGSTYNAAANSGGNLYVMSGGSAIDASQNSGGNINVSVMGGNSNTYVSGTNQNGQTMTLSNGVASNFIINSGGSMYAVTGGLAKDTTVNSGGALSVGYGGSASNVLQNSGGNINVSVVGGDYAVVSGTNQNGQAFTYSNGVASNFIVNSGGYQYVAYGGSAVNTLVNNSGWFSVSGGKASGVSQASGGNISVYMSKGDTSTYLSGVNQDGGKLYYSNGVASGFVLNQALWLGVSSGVSAYDFTVNNSGYLAVSSGGSAVGLNVKSGGILQVSSVDGTDTQTYISGVNQNGGKLLLSSGVASGFVIAGYNSLYVSSGGKIYDTVVEGVMDSSGQYMSSAYINMGSNASAINTTVNSGGVLYAYSNALVSGLTINDGYVSGGYNVTFADVSANGGNFQLYSGSAKNLTFDNGAYASISYADVTGLTIGGGALYSGYSGTVKNITINSGGLMAYGWGGVLSNTTINSGGMLLASGAINAFSTVVKNGGTEWVYSAVEHNAIVEGEQHLSWGATTINANVRSGGLQTLAFSGAIALATQLNNGGSQYVADTATATGTVINSGGLQVVDALGKANETTINKGGVQLLMTAGSATGGTVHSGGRILLQGGTLEGDTFVNKGGILDGSIGFIDTLTLNSGNWINAGGGSASEVVTNGGTVDLRGAIPGAWQTLTIDNLYASGGVFNMNVALGNDSSPSDQLVVTNTFDGSALIKVFNMYGIGEETTSDGIKLVDLQGSSNGTFALVGGKADAGAYEYNLFQGGVTPSADPLDWYLRSSQKQTNVFKTMQNIPEMNAVMALTGMNSLEKRLGDLRSLGNADKHNGVWARTYAKDMTVSGAIDTDMTLYGVEAGYDYLFNPGEPNKIYLGFMAGYMQNGKIKTKQDNGQYGKGNGEAPNVGVYGSLIAENGWFIDIAARNFWTKIDMTNYDAGGTPLLYSPERNILAASVEVGKAFKVGMGGRNYLRFEPKGEILYMKAGSDTTAVINGAGDLSYGAANYLSGKGSLLLGYTKIRNNGLAVEPYIEVGYANEFSGKGKVYYAGAEYETDLSGGTASGALGLNLQLTKDAYLYGQGTYETGSKIKAVGGNLGIRVGFGGVESSAAARSVPVSKAVEAAPEKEKPAPAPKPVEAVQPVQTVQYVPAAAPVVYYVNPAPQTQPVVQAPQTADRADGFASVVFEFNNKALEASDKDYLKQKATELKRINYEKVIVTGHSDNIGSYKANQKISFARAKAVAAELEKNGIPASKMELRAEPYYGPLFNGTDEERALNRVAVIEVAGADGQRIK